MITARVILLILFSSIVNANIITAESRGPFSCSPAGIDELPGNWTIEDQSCLRVDLGIKNPGDTIFFTISSSSEIDILLFTGDAIAAYQNGQSYRLESIWESESIFEFFTGSGEWHWQVPSDRDETRWYLVIDNQKHPQDQGEGSQGGQSVEISLDSGIINHTEFTLSDTIHRVDPSSYKIAYGPFPVDEGTFVEIYARTMEGSPDIFIMSESAFSLYSPDTNWNQGSRFSSADMLVISNERYLPWLAPDTNDEEIYVIIDNRPGPGGGDNGLNPAGITVTVSLTPVISPVITLQKISESVDVGETIILSASDTPNKSNQINESGYFWDINDDGITDYTGPSISYKWDKPGNYEVELTAISIDSRSSSGKIIVEVSDNSNPIVNLDSSEQIQKGFGEIISLTASFSDNWEVTSLEWLIDGNTVISNDSISDQITIFSFDMNFQDYNPGNHEVIVRVIDKSGRSSEDSIIINLVDITPPSIQLNAEDVVLTAGDQYQFQGIAEDLESKTPLIHSWVFNQGSSNELRKDGATVIHEFNQVGTQYVIYSVENEAGLSSQKEILIQVEEINEPTPFIFSSIFLIIIAIASIIIISYVFFNRAVANKMEELVNVVKNTEKDGNEKHQIEKSNTEFNESDNSRFAPEPSYQFESSSESISSINNEISPEIAELLGVNSQNNFTEKDALENFLDLENEVEEKQINNRVVRTSCSKCKEQFQLELPEGLDSAFTNCPFCNSEEFVSL